MQDKKTQYKLENNELKKVCVKWFLKNGHINQLKNKQKIFLQYNNDEIWKDRNSKRKMLKWIIQLSQNQLKQKLILSIRLNIQINKKTISFDNA